MSTALPISEPVPVDDLREQAGSIIRVPEADAIQNHQRKYAYYTWCPSMGHLYDGKFPGGEILLSPMTAGEEKILAQAKADKADVINTIIQRCLVSCPVAFNDLLVSDVLYMLLVVRNITYGTDYTFRVVCANCSTEYTKQLLLPKGLQIRCLGDEDEGEPWDLVLPRSKDRVQYRLLRVKDEADIRRWAKQAYQRSVQEGDPAYTYRLAKHLTTVNGKELSPLEKLPYCEQMIGMDTNALRNAIGSRDFGVQMTIDPECPSCGHQQKQRLPFDREFFRPGDSER